MPAGRVENHAIMQLRVGVSRRRLERGFQQNQRLFHLAKPKAGEPEHSQRLWIALLAGS
jgi:hypothetical protein